MVVLLTILGTIFLIVSAIFWSETPKLRTVSIVIATVAAILMTFDLVHHKDSDNVWMTDFEKRLTSPIAPSTICQFTGLKDCKDNEIFEHDLIHFVGHKPIGEVIWSEEDYAFMIASENEPLYWLSDVLEIGKIERVGNKFDRKEGEK